MADTPAELESVRAERDAAVLHRSNLTTQVLQLTKPGTWLPRIAAAAGFKADEVTDFLDLDPTNPEHVATWVGELRAERDRLAATIARVEALCDRVEAKARGWNFDAIGPVVPLTNLRSALAGPPEDRNFSELTGHPLLHDGHPFQPGVCSAGRCAEPTPEPTEWHPLGPLDTYGEAT